MKEQRRYTRQANMKEGEIVTLCLCVYECVSERKPERERENESAGRS